MDRSMRNWVSFSNNYILSTCEDSLVFLPRRHQMSRRDGMELMISTSDVLDVCCGPMEGMLAGNSSWPYPLGFLNQS